MKKEKSEAVRIACVDNFSGSETVRHWMQMGGTWAAVTEQTAAKNGLEGSRLEDGRQYHMVRQITALLAASLAVYNRVYNFDLTMREGRKCCELRGIRLIVALAYSRVAEEVRFGHAGHPFTRH